jgi:hypothetical protein
MLLFFLAASIATSVLSRAPPSSISMVFNEISVELAAAVLSHVDDPVDRLRLAAVRSVYCTVDLIRDATRHSR